MLKNGKTGTSTDNKKVFRGKTEKPTLKMAKTENPKPPFHYLYHCYRKPT